MATTTAAAASAVAPHAGPSITTAQSIPAESSLSSVATPTNSMFHSRTHIKAGDLVIIHLTRTEYLAITVTPGQHFHNKFGRYVHNDMIGLPFGTKMLSPPPQVGYIYLLRPTPELWTLSLPHRTQILYNPDISYIIMRLGVRVGGKVIEAGTGSGSMTHSLARAVGPHGYVGSYEYHHTRYTKAQEEFDAHGLSNVRLQHRNVCKDGFGDVDNVEAVFLDLPAPWEAIPLVLSNLRDDANTKICCFSPCIEQVHKTCTALREHGFSDVSTQEVLVRIHELPGTSRSAVQPLRDVTSIVQGLKDHDQRKAERRVVQMRNAREKAARLKAQADKLAEESGEGVKDGAGTEGDVPKIGSKRKAQDADVSVEGGAYADEDADADADLDLDQDQDEAEAEAAAGIADIDEDDNTTPTPTNHITWTPPAEPSSTLFSQILLRTQPDMRGHTSYLTFATLPPRSVREALAAQGDRTGSGWSTPNPPNAGRAGKETNKAKTSGLAVAGESAGATSIERRTGKGTANAPIAVSSTGTEGKASDVGADDKTEMTAATDYGDQALEQAMGTLTEEEMAAMMAGSKA